MEFMRLFYSLLFGFVERKGKPFFRYNFIQNKRLGLNFVFIKTRLVFVLWLFLAAPLAFAQPVKELMKGEEIRALVTDNTVAGYYKNGLYFSEFHAKDGRALGHNGYARNVDACWTIENNNICYHYGIPGKRQSFCFTFEKIEGILVQKIAETGAVNSFSRVEPGNPRQHDDGGKTWSCADLLS